MSTRKELDGIIERAFEVCRRHGALTWGMYTIHNERMMYGALSKARYSMDRLFAGTVFGIIRTTQVFNEEYHTKEDYEYLLQQAKGGRPVIRFNGISPYAEHFSKGGCEESRGRERDFSAVLLSCEFPEYIRQNPRKPEEVRQIKPLY